MVTLPKIRINKMTLFYFLHYHRIHLLLFLLLFLVMKEPFCLCGPDELTPVKNVSKSNFGSGTQVHIWPSQKLPQCVWLQGVLKLGGITISSTEPQLVCETSSFRISAEKPSGFDEGKRLAKIAEQASRSK